VGGKTAIELLRRKGFVVSLFQFTRSKNEYYEYMKVALANKRVELYKDAPLISQLKALESVESASGNIQIKKPLGGRDDICDALMLGLSPFIKMAQGGEWKFVNFKKGRSIR
jgi:hypothetical protein